MSILFFDTETSGLPITKSFNNYYNYTELDKYKNSRLLSICWKIYKNNKIIKNYYNIIKPRDFLIDNNSIACKINGITQEKANIEGIYIEDVFNELFKDIQNIDRIVAHNINFDKHILLSELFRNNRLDIIELFNKKDLFCTMMQGINITKIKFRNNLYKPPKLIELYKHFFNEEFNNAHNAEADVNACVKCYFEMVK